MMLSQPTPEVLKVDPNWFTQLWRLCLTIGDHGTMAQRPVKGLFVGRMYFDDSLTKPIWFDGTHWRDSAGTIV